MRLLLDTHIVLWAVLDDPRLKPAHRAAIAEADALFISAASVWEVSIKTALGKLDVPDDLFDTARAAGAQALPITWEHASVAGALPPYHADPFDRMLIAQARHENIVLVTADQRMKAYQDLATLL